MSPQYPSKYPPNVDCLWKIIGYSEDVQLVFNITDLQLGDGDNTNCDQAADYIEIRNVNPITHNVTEEVTRLCGSPKDFNSSALVSPSSSSTVFVYFHSSSQTKFVLRQRFIMTITTKALRCVHEINAPSGIITSPGYPNPVPRSWFFYCSWIITVPKGRRVSLKFLDYDLESAKENSWADYKLSFYTGVMTYLGSSTAQEAQAGKVVESFNNVLKIRYWDDAISGAHKGFKAEFSSDKPAVCGGELADSGTVAFSAVDSNMTFYYCEWIHSRNMETTNNQSTFTMVIDGTLNKNSTGTCGLLPSSTQESIIIHNKALFVPEGGLSSASYFGKVIGHMCENKLESVTVRSPFPNTEILARKMARFPLRKQAAIPSAANFRISFKTDSCGGIIEGPNATITSPGFPGQYPASIDCAWLVEFQPNTKIHETMMTPRSRKPVMAVSASNICHLANLTWGVKESSSWDNVRTSLGLDSFGMEGSYSGDSLCGAFKEYLSSRSVLTASPVDLSFSSRTGDFDPSSDARFEELESVSNIENEVNSPLSESLLYILDGNLPNDLSSNSSGFGDSRPKKRDAESEDNKPNKRFGPCDVSCESSGLGTENSREVPNETSL